ncbi:hypothetical protein LCGC14_0645170 [marine sediment metagenome]|jgi:hypothetical protein|uniref:Uncharacterized protein n=1 Tax=marine sediment metagenome TaxID=412755 RepID=A0A0F9QY11_9ZZZZ|tara:strand:- start:1839 stop:2045 length:207 start_codon:yes stop_codon:yes gene_type:complete
MAERQLLTQLPHALSEAEYRNPGYRQLYEAARSARIPVAKDGQGRWTFAPADLPAIAATLGLAQNHAA